MAKARGALAVLVYPLGLTRSNETALRLATRAKDAIGIGPASLNSSHFGHPVVLPWQRTQETTIRSIATARGLEGCFMDVFSLRQQLIGDYASYIQSFINIRD